MDVFIFRLNIDEVLQILETNDNENQESKDENEEIRGKDIDKIVIFPPKDGAETDDDSDDDDTRNLNHLTAPQLVSECEIEVSVRETGKSENDNTKSGRQPRIRKKDKLWKANCELPQWSDSEQYVQVQGALGDFMTPIECFELCFDKSLVKHLGYLGTYQSPAIKSPNCGSRGEKRVHQSVRTDDDMYKRHATKLVVRSVINELE
ncbi:hypothetical protein Pmani_017078 [Petrolisthes manimaculis]|uniref:Uncharacterized protein n=1 Tax=Petrolisthes manimaculis TaxID=1843537 RepID=A0AAE1U5T2_9EUCA|nr:hypothetical protein Pmani_017078 [Petrolisthes manimaculis]